MKASRKATQDNKRKGSGNGKKSEKKHEGGGNRNRKFKQAMKNPDGLKTIMSVLYEEEKTNTYLIVALQYVQTPDTNTDPQITVINPLLLIHP